ncbi:hypothetical protein C5167_045051 [Papaver somniferum]|uniref:Uncharacterized protein n=1 Tax=Papaver somniferum TaxID=3469 RepID=A0A4Y7LC54_PAPSO|nr:hypothetical protein C5167_045051 [Papaver somniferum]
MASPNVPSSGKSRIIIQSPNSSSNPRMTKISKGSLRMTRRVKQPPVIKTQLDLPSFKMLPSSASQVPLGETTNSSLHGTIPSLQANITTSSCPTTSAQASVIASLLSSTSSLVQNPCMDVIPLAFSNPLLSSGMISSSTELMVTTQAITFSTEESTASLQDIPISNFVAILVYMDCPTLSLSEASTAISSPSTVMTTSPLRTGTSSHASVVTSEMYASDGSSSGTSPLLGIVQLACSSSMDPSQRRLCESLVKLLSDSPPDKSLGVALFNLKVFQNLVPPSENLPPRLPA